jgi:hypothetical protein
MLLFFIAREGEAMIIVITALIVETARKSSPLFLRPK